MSDTKINLSEENAENTENFYHDPFLGRTISLGIKKPSSKSLKSESTNPKTKKNNSSDAEQKSSKYQISNNSNLYTGFQNNLSAGYTNVQKKKNSQRNNFGTDFVEAINVTSYGSSQESASDKNQIDNKFNQKSFKTKRVEGKFEGDFEGDYKDFENYFEGVKKDDAELFEYEAQDKETQNTNQGINQSKKGSFLKDEDSVSKVPTGAAFFEENLEEMDTDKEGLSSLKDVSNNLEDGLSETEDFSGDYSFGEQNITKTENKIENNHSINLKNENPKSESKFESKSESLENLEASEKNSLNSSQDNKTDFDKDSAFGPSYLNKDSNETKEENLETDEGYDFDGNSVHANLYNVDHFDRQYQEKLGNVVSKTNNTGEIKTENFGIEINETNSQNLYYSSHSSQKTNSKESKDFQNLTQESQEGYDYSIDYDKDKKEDFLRNKFLAKEIVKKIDKNSANPYSKSFYNEVNQQANNQQKLEKENPSQLNPKFVMVDPTEGLKDAQKRFEDALNKQKAYSSGTENQTNQEDFDFESNKQKINKKAVFGKLFTGNSLGLIAFGSLLSAIIFYFGFLQPLIITDITQKTNQKISNNSENIQIQANKYLEFQNSLATNFSFNRSISCGGSSYTKSEQDVAKLNQLLGQEMVLKYEEFEFKPLTSYKIEKEYNDLYDSYNRVINIYREKTESLKDIISYLTFRNQIIEFCKNIENQENFSRVKLECETIKPLTDSASFGAEELIPAAPLIRDLDQKCQGSDKTEILEASLKIIEFSPDYSNQRERLRITSENLRLESKSVSNKIIKIYDEKTSWPGIIYLLDW